jgi:L,D-peptidoglycan transpeptidase YkuD (ErfK/YbiS/YcfS/YnhG family)
MIFVATANGQFHFGQTVVPCALGRGGVMAAETKTEGDGASPIGTWPIRRFLYRADRLQMPNTQLALSAIQPNDGWCDASHDPAYNQAVTVPYPASCENLWREDGVYDLIGILGHNDEPVVPDRGSAIFLHIARSGYLPTEGCIALRLEHMLEVMALAGPGSAIKITGA